MRPTVQTYIQEVLPYGQLANFVAELPQSPEVEETNRSDLANVMPHRQFAVEPSPKMAHNIGAVDAVPQIDKTLYVICQKSRSFGQRN